MTAPEAHPEFVYVRGLTGRNPTQHKARRRGALTLCGQNTAESPGWGRWLVARPEFLSGKVGRCEKCYPLEKR